MSNKKLVILGVVAIVMVILAGVQLKINSTISSGPSKGPSYLLQGLNTDQIASFTLAIGSDQIILARKGKRFVVANKDDYPAKSTEINGVIAASLDIKTVEFVTDRVENHKDLGVTEAVAGHVVKFFDADKNLLTGLLISKPDNTKSVSYVRLISSNDVYLTIDRPWPPTFAAMDFIDKTLLSLNRSDIVSVTVTSQDQSYTLKAEGAGTNVVLENMPESKQFKGTDYETVFSDLTKLSFDDVTKENADTAKLKFDSKYICTIKDSTVYTFEIAKSEDKNYVRCNAMYTDKTLVTKKQEVESEEELKKKEAILVARDNARKFSEKHTGWIYQIPKYKADSMTKKLEDLLEDKNKSEESDSDNNA
ncbi:MAG: DUF4340 domain-containing protein [Planctomycetota bacterium]|jgi:hypothetical protein